MTIMRKRKLLPASLLLAFCLSLLVGCGVTMEPVTESSEWEEIEPVNQAVEKEADTREEAKEKTEKVSSALSIAWAKDVLPTLSDYAEFAATTDEGSCQVVLSTDGQIEDLRVYGLTLDYIEEGTSIHFSKEELYSHGTLTRKKPLVLTVIFYGTVPYYGISYTDTNGETRYYAIDESGMDGSVLLWEIE